MGYAIYKLNKNRLAGYGVPAICDHPDCNKEIDRGVSYACGEPMSSEVGCDRYFCSEHKKTYHHDDSTGEQCFHLVGDCHCRSFSICNRCFENYQMEGDMYWKDSYKEKPETEEWLKHFLTDDSWEECRNDPENKELVDNYKEQYEKHRNENG